MDGWTRATPIRSCVACRRRKIRCDKKQPCSYCTRLQLDCTYPTPGQDAKKTPTEDVLSRLRQIEISLKRIEANTIASNPPHPSASQPSLESFCLSKNPSTTHTEESPSTGSARLVLEDGDTRYVTGSFWTDLDRGENDADEQTDLRSREFNSSFPLGAPNSHSLVFGPDGGIIDTQVLHPTEPRIFTHWQVFIDSVDPVLKLVHVPTTQRQLLLACQNLGAIPPAFESLMFAIYFAAVASTRSSVSRQTLEVEERQKLLNRYRIGVEQSLAKANFLSTPNVTTLQALTLYLTCAREFVDKTYIWALIGLLVRLAMKLGLHRDPAALNLSPFMSEMRRRLWWHICILDIRTAEDNDMEPLICEHVYDTKFPANIHDSDLDMHMTQPPAERRTRTEMLFTLTRFEISNAARKLLFSTKFSADNGYKCYSVQEKNDQIDALSKELDEKYFHDFDERIPICFLTRMSTQMVLAKMKLTINHPSRCEAVGMSQERLCALIQSSIDLVQCAQRLRSNDTYSKWTWLFQKYIEWDAVAFLLHSMSAAAFPDILGNACNVIDQFFQYWSGNISDRDRRWQRLQILRAKAAARRNPLQQGLDMFGHSSEQNIIEPSHASRNHKEFSLVESSLAPQEVGKSLQQDHSVEQEDNSENAGLSSPVDFSSWNFDNIPYTMQGVASWEMSIEDETFRPPT